MSTDDDRRNEVVKISMPTSVEVHLYTEDENPKACNVHLHASAINIETQKPDNFSSKTRALEPFTRHDLLDFVVDWIRHEVAEQLGMDPHRNDVRDQLSRDVQASRDRNADRIAALEAELAEERETTSRRISSADGLRAIAERDLAAERAAHERTKAERDEAQQNARADLQVTKNIAAERDAAQAEAARLQCIENCAPSWETFPCGKCLCCVRAGAAAMRGMLTLLETRLMTLEAEGRTDYDRIVNGCLEMIEALRVARGGSAGRALAARVPLLEAVATDVRALVGWALHPLVCNVFGRMREALESLRVKLTALDEKGTTDV